MGFNSTADLLFRIGADGSDAENNIKRFRSLLSKDLSGLRAEFGDWAQSVFGDLNTVGGAMKAGTAALAAGVVAVGAAMVAAAGKTAQFAQEIDDGATKTGLSAERISELRFAAEQVGVGYDGLIASLVKFQREVDAAANSTQKHQQTFGRLGISQQEVRLGAQDLMPLIERVMDRYQDLGASVDRVTVAQELFGKAGAENLDFLALGAEGLRTLTQRARELGRVITDENIVAAKEYKIALGEMRAQWDGITFQLGTVALPILREISIWFTAFVETARNKPAFSEPITFFISQLEEARKRIQQLAAAAAATEAGTKRLGPGKEAAEAYEKLAGLLEDVKLRMAGLAGEGPRILAEMEALRAKVRELKVDAKSTADAIEAINRLERQAIKSFGEEAVEKGKQGLQKITDLRVGFSEFRTELARETQEFQNWLREQEILQLEAFDTELRQMQHHLAGIVAARLNSRDRLKLVAELEAEDLRHAVQKSLKGATPEQRDVLLQQYGLNVEALKNKLSEDLAVLANSEGWRAVFGEEFARALRGNEEALREWALSVDQAMSLARISTAVTMATLQQGMQFFSRAMAANIAQAVVWRQSVGEAVRSAVAATLQGIAAESFVHAIFATALGFLRLAQHNFPAAAAAFKSAALFGSVGAAAAVAGRAVAPQRGTAGEAEGGGVRGSAGDSAGGASGSQERPGPRIVINIGGSVIGVSGAEELVQLINEQVVERDARLVATVVRQPGRATP